MHFKACNACFLIWTCLSGNSPGCSWQRVPLDPGQAPQPPSLLRRGPQLRRQVTGTGRGGRGRRGPRHTSARGESVSLSARKGNEGCLLLSLLPSAPLNEQADFGKTSPSLRCYYQQVSAQQWARQPPYTRLQKPQTLPSSPCCAENRQRETLLPGRR